MVHITYLLPSILLLLSEIRHSCLNSSKKLHTLTLLNLVGTVYGLPKQDEFAQELQNEELLLSMIEEPSSKELDGSGDFEIVATEEKDSGCLETAESSVCSNRGRCVDNKCLCDSFQFVDDNNETILYRHSGKFCEECPYCRAQRCYQFLPCIECFQKNESCNSCLFENYTIVDKVVRDVNNDEKFCDIDDFNGCYFRFKYFYNSENSVEVLYERDISCFNGLKIVKFTFWGVVVYVFALALVVPRLCSLSKQNQVNKSRMSLSTGHDVLRINQLTTINSNI